MNFTKFFTAYEKESALFDHMMDKANVMFDAIEREHEINLQSSELKVLKESGTAEDLLFLYEAAKEEKENKFVKVVTAIVDKAVAFFEKVVQWFKDLFTSAKTKKSLEELDKTIKSDKSLSSKKIQYTDYTKDTKRLQKELNDLEKERRKVEAGVEPAKSHKISRGMIIGGSVATVTLGAAVGLLAKISKDAHKSATENTKALKNRRDEILKIVKEEKEVLRTSKKDKDETMVSTQKEILAILHKQLTAIEVDLRKQETDCWKKTAMSLFSSMKSAVTGVFKRDKKNDKVEDKTDDVKALPNTIDDVTESYVDSEYDLDEYLMTESFDTDVYLESILKDLKRPKAPEYPGLNASDAEWDEYGDKANQYLNDMKKHAKAIGTVSSIALGLASTAIAANAIYKHKKSSNPSIKTLTKKYEELVQSIKKDELKLKHMLKTRKTLEETIKQTIKSHYNSRDEKSLAKLHTELYVLDSAIEKVSEKIKNDTEKLKELEKRIEEMQEKRVDKIKNAFSFHKESSDDVDEYLATLESELFGDDDDLVEESSDDVDEYLATLESELFGDDDDLVEESYEHDILDDIFG